MKKFKVISQLMMAAALVLTVAACGKNEAPKKKVAKVPTTVNGQVIPSCTGCPGNMAFLDSALGIMDNGGVPGMELTLSFFGDPAALGAGYPIGGVAGAGGVFTNTSYNGPVAATGKMIVAIPYQMCGVLPGTYTVQTAVPGVWMYKYSFGGIELIATGPTTVRLWLQGFVNAAIPPAQSADGRTFPFRLQSRVVMSGMAGTLMPCDRIVY